MRTLQLLFGRHFLVDVLRSVGESRDPLLDDPTADTRGPFAFCERLYPMTSAAGRVIRFVHVVWQLDRPDALWLEEQLYLLATRLLMAHRVALQRARRLAPRSRGLRREIHARIMRTADLIRSRYSEPLTLERMAAEAHMSRHHFLRTFKTLVGATPYAFLQARRIEAACRLLRTTALTVTEVADQVGYDSATTLYRNLKRYTRRTPTELRAAAAERSN